MITKAGFVLCLSHDFKGWILFKSSVFFCNWLMLHKLLCTSKQLPVWAWDLPEKCAAQEISFVWQSLSILDICVISFLWINVSEKNVIMFKRSKNGGKICAFFFGNFGVSKIYFHCPKRRTEAGIKNWSCYLWFIFDQFIVGLSAQCVCWGIRIPQLQEGDEMRLECRTCDNKLVFFRWWQRWGHPTRAWKWQALWPAARDTWESVEYGGVMQRWLNMTMVSIKTGCNNEWFQVVNMDTDVMAMLQKSISAKVTTRTRMCCH